MVLISLSLSLAQVVAIIAQRLGPLGWLKDWRPVPRDGTAHVHGVAGEATYTLTLLTLIVGASKTRCW